MINSKNYYERIKDIDVSALPDKFKEGHDVVNFVTGDGKSWQVYDEDKDTRATIDVYFKQLDEYLSKRAKTPETKEKAAPKAKPERKTIAQVFKEKDKGGQKVSSHHVEMKKKDTVELVERIPEELRFIKRYINLNGKSKTKDQILSFVNSLQKAIVEKRIRKTSAYADQIEQIQDVLIKTYYKMKNKARFEVDETSLTYFKFLVQSEQLIASVPFIKRYIGLNEKESVKGKAALLLKQIENAEDKKKLTRNDPYWKFLLRIKKNLQAFISDRTKKTLFIEKNELNGLEGVLGCACQSLNGIDDVEDEENIDTIEQGEDEPRIMNSMDFANVKFITIGLKGKWYDLIGDPTPGFTAMVFGKPKMGKSYLCVEFAGYLARHHGKVLYVAKEEGLDATLQLKTKDKDVAHPNLTISDGLPKDLSPYDYIFLDSVTKLRLSPSDLEQLEKENPGKSFIYIFQTTKTGNFKGANAFQHEVDIVIEVPEKGVAIQNGRFNQGGQIGVFKNDLPNKIAA